MQAAFCSDSRESEVFEQQPYSLDGPQLGAHIIAFSNARGRNLPEEMLLILKGWPATNGVTTPESTLKYSILVLIELADDTRRY